MALAVLLRDPEENPVALSDRPFRTGPAEEGGGAPGRGCQPPPPLPRGLCSCGASPPPRRFAPCGEYFCSPRVAGCPERP